MTSTSTSKQIGKVALTPAGNWDNTNEYEKLDVVYYQGGSYVAKKAVPVATNITNEEYWQTLAEKAPSLTIGTVTTVSASTNASASIGGTADAPTLNLSIPRGVTGNESIDDNKGDGDTDYVWSADKCYHETITPIAPDRTSFAHQQNFLDVEDCSVNYSVPLSIVATTILDNISSNTNYVISKIYKCHPGEKYTINKQNGTTSNKTIYMGDKNKIAYGMQKYDDNKVANADGTYTFTIPTGVYYFRWCFTINTTGWSGDGWKTKAMICKGTSLPSEYIGNDVSIDGINIKKTRSEVDILSKNMDDLIGVAPKVFTGTGEQSAYIPYTLSVGDTISFTSNSYRKIYSAPISEGDEIWLVNCAGASNKQHRMWAIVDEDEKIVAIPSYLAEGDRMSCKIKAPANSAKLYWSVAQTKSMIIKENNKFVLYKGNKTIPVISATSATITNGTDNIDKAKSKVVTFAENGYIDYPLTSERYINVGVWVKCDYNNASKLSNLSISLMSGSTVRGTATIGQDRLKVGQWVFAKLSIMDNAVDNIRVSPTFATGNTSAIVSVSPFVVTDQITRPIAIINFDNTWQASEDCGAYDLLINNNIPFSITGVLSGVDSATQAKLLNAYAKGLLDIGVYGNEHYGDDYYPINSGANMITANTNMLTVLNYKHENGIAPISFGPQNQIITQNIIRTLKDFCFKITRVYGTPYGVNAMYTDKDLVCITETHTSYPESVIESAVGLSGPFGMFAHGVSSNPSGETNPSLYTPYTNFSAMVTALINMRDNNSVEVMNLRQFAEFVKNDYELL